MTTLNGLPNSWESFIQGIFSGRKLTKFNRLWEDCTQEEARLEARKEKIESNEDHALTTFARKGKGKKEVHSHKRFQNPHKGQDSHKDLSSSRCFIFQKMGHIARNCPQAKNQNKNKKFRRHHAHFAGEDELDQKKNKRR
jgi:hypothetical protein